MSIRILIAENATPMALFMQRTLQKQGYKVTTVADAADAILLIEEHKYDVLITDLSLPPCDVGGVGLLEAAKTLRPKLRRMIASGSESPVDSGLAQARVMKPFNQDELLTAVTELTRNSARMLIGA